MNYEVYGEPRPTSCLFTTIHRRVVLNILMDGMKTKYSLTAKKILHCHYIV